MILFTDIQVSNVDIEGVDFVGVMKATHIYITGNVLTEDIHYTTLKVHHFYQIIHVYQPFYLCIQLHIGCSIF